MSVIKNKDVKRKSFVDNSCYLYPAEPLYCKRYS